MQTGYVYKVSSDKCDEVYIGSTILTIEERFQLHKNEYIRWLDDKEVSCLSIYPFYKLYGIENFNIKIIKEYQVCDRNHLFAYETLWICKCRKRCVNLYMPVGYLKKELRKGYMEKYRLEHSELRKEYNEKYRLEHSEQIKEYNEKYILEHSELRKGYMEKYRLEHAETIKAKTACPCGGKYTYSSKALHFKTKKHQFYLNSLPPVE
tara:strand:+ start:180 stop:800 length:621 start_codon:yes stop_codon:yes gene_type:complete